MPGCGAATSRARWRCSTTCSRAPCCRRCCNWRRGSCAARAHEARGDRQRAIADLERAVALAPDDARTLNELGIVLLDAARARACRRGAHARGHRGPALRPGVEQPRQRASGRPAMSTVPWLRSSARRARIRRMRSRTPTSARCGASAATTPAPKAALVARAVARSRTAHRARWRWPACAGSAALSTPRRRSTPTRRGVDPRDANAPRCCSRRRSPSATTWRGARNAYDQALARDPAHAARGARPRADVADGARERGGARRGACGLRGGARRASSTRCRRRPRRSVPRARRTSCAGRTSCSRIRAATTRAAEALRRSRGADRRGARSGVCRRSRRTRRDYAVARRIRVGLLPRWHRGALFRALDHGPSARAVRDRRLRAERGRRRAHRTAPRARRPLPCRRAPAAVRARAAPARRGARRDRLSRGGHGRHDVRAGGAAARAGAMRRMGPPGDDGPAIDRRLLHERHDGAARRRTSITASGSFDYPGSARATPHRTFQRRSRARRSACPRTCRCCCARNRCSSCTRTTIACSRACSRPRRVRGWSSSKDAILR